MFCRDIKTTDVPVHDTIKTAFTSTNKRPECCGADTQTHWNSEQEDSEA
tara:strand:- start:104 stop:250 length:147 start_codon:yes stop_codon:yes gene_type:complete